MCLFKKSFIVSLLLTLNSPSFALVDYSDSIPGVEEKNASNKSVQRLGPSPQSSRSLTWKADFSFTTNYESMEIEGNKYGVMNIGTHIQTPANIYFDANYWTASSDNGSQNGNPKLILGFNWLRMGSPSDEARFDFYGGVRLPSSSEIGSSRMDKIFGAETTKRFGTFGLGIGFDLTLTGTPKNSLHTDIGNIQRLTVSGGWMVSNDIQFEIEAENFKILKSDNSSVRGLEEDVSFSTLSPKLNLGIIPAVNLELGARFRMKKPQRGTNLLDLQVFDLHGANSNSLFAGLNVTI